MEKKSKIFILKQNRNLSKEKYKIMESTPSPHKLKISLQIKRINNRNVFNKA